MTKMDDNQYPWLHTNAGTSEGAKKAWDTRGRGRNDIENSTAPSTTSSEQPATSTEVTAKHGMTVKKEAKVNMYPQDLTAMNKKMQTEYLKDVIRNKTFKQMREEQDLVAQQQGTAYKTATTSKDPGERERAELALKNLGVHEQMLMTAIDLVSFDSKKARKIVEEATGIPWDKLPKEKKSK